MKACKVFTVFIKPFCGTTKKYENENFYPSSEIGILRAKKNFMVSSKVNNKL